MDVGPMEGACDDRDEDGYLSTACGGTDCDDDDPNVSPGAFEICDDGIDNDCNELVDEADPACSGCVPDAFDAFERVAATFLGLNAGAFVIRGDRYWLWHQESRTVMREGSLAELWASISTSGTPPPTSRIDALAFAPVGRIAPGLGQTVLVAAGSKLYVYGGESWAEHELSEMVAGLSRVDSMTFLATGGNWVWFATQGETLYWQTTQAGAWQDADALASLCPEGSTGRCPRGVSSLTGWDASIGVAHRDEVSYATILLPRNWVPYRLSTTLCPEE